MHLTYMSVLLIWLLRGVLGAPSDTDRIVVAKLVAKPLNLAIIQVYAPTSDSEEVEVEKFYEEIGKAKDYLKSHDTIIVMVDFNAKIGDERIEDVVGPSGIGNINERGSRLIKWCQINGFTITNTCYQNHPVATVDLEEPR
ncbi:craniofacial development protein 2-like [Plakobranchus ocellatus]|uniref:Craniofacial development protein 2-like n=1 Tax=Plakobranchus ocellatus TaxID=259542 RepID=A0AAV3ZGL4_9GAST|nr:craniofacial development protein 2-like [Plakobranchus ocellatus]